MEDCVLSACWMLELKKFPYKRCHLTVIAVTLGTALLPRGSVMYAAATGVTYHVLPGIDHMTEIAATARQTNSALGRCSHVTAWPLSTFSVNFLEGHLIECCALKWYNTCEWSCTNHLLITGHLAVCMKQRIRQGTFECRWSMRASPGRI